MADPIDPATPPVDPATPPVAPPVEPATPPVDPAAPPPTPLDPPADPDAKPPVGDFPDDWREKLAGDDAKFLATLKRYSSPKSFSDAFKALRQKMSSGELKESLKENATPEELAEFRKQNGIPEAPEAYLDKLPDGLVIGDDDKPAFEKLAATLHGLNAPKPIYDAVARVYFDVLEEQQAEQFEQFREAKTLTEDELRAEWGGDYRRNVNLVNGFLDGAPDGVKDVLTGAVFTDPETGKAVPLASHAGVLRWLADLAREINPVATVVPGAGANQASAIADEMASLKTMMANRHSEYWKGPNAEKHQARYRELLGAQQKLQARAA